MANNFISSLAYILWDLFFLIFFFSLLEMVMTFANQQTRLSVKQADASIKSCLKSVYTTAFKIVTVVRLLLRYRLVVCLVIKLCLSCRYVGMQGM